MKQYIVLFMLFILLICFPLFPEVKNPDKPLKGDWNLKAVKVWQTSKYGKKTMAIPRIGAVSKDGTICMFDYKHQAHFIITGSGEFQTGFGKRGEGPGEVRFAWRYFSVTDKFIVYDRPKLHYFLTDGTYVKSIPIGGRFDPPELFINENEYISYSDSGTVRTLSHVNLKEGTKNIIKKISQADGALRESAGGGKVITIGGIPGLAPEFASTLDINNKRLYYGVSDRYLIEICGMQGNALGNFSVERHKIKFKKKMLNLFSRGERRMFKQRYKKIVAKFPELTYFQKMQFEKGLILVHVVYLGDSWEKQQIDIFSPGGTYLYRTFFTPADGERIRGKVVIKNGYLYTIQEDRDDELKLVKYKIALPEK